MKLSVSMKKVLVLLTSRYPHAVSPISIGAEINGKGAGWAAPVCGRLLQAKLVEKDELGHFKATALALKVIQ